MALDTDGVRLVPLASEADFAGVYLDVERMRFQERLQASIDVPAPLGQALVPSFILQPLVENAVHHAVSPSRDPRRLDIEARARDGWLSITVRDDGPGLADEAMSRRRGAIGLAATTARLEHLLGSRCSLTVRNREDGGAEAEILVPLQFAATESAGKDVDDAQDRHRRRRDAGAAAHH